MNNPFYTHSKPSSEPFRIKVQARSYGKIKSLTEALKKAEKDFNLSRNCIVKTKLLQDITKYRQELKALNNPREYKCIIEERDEYFICHYTLTVSAYNEVEAEKRAKKIVTGVTPCKASNLIVISIKEK